MLWDIQQELLDAVVAELRDSGFTGKLLAQRVDVSNSEQIAASAQEALDVVGVPKVLSNNAGIVRGKYFLEHDPQRDIEATMKINALAPMLTTRAFLPAMVESMQEHRIVNIASAAGLVSNPRMSIYAASKWAAVGFSDSLRLELERTGNRRIKVTTVCPNYISTGMFEGVGRILMTRLLTPEEVTDKVWATLKVGKPYLLMPWSTQVGKIAKGILPTRLSDLVADKVLGVYSTMDSFKGRGPEKKLETPDAGQRVS